MKLWRQGKFEAKGVIKADYGEAKGRGGAAHLSSPIK